ncbi:MAG: HNH endonuclease signature motif containing protein [Mycobacterium sp.]
MFDGNAEPVALLQRVCSAARAEACAAAERLVAIGELVRLRMTQSGETQDWAVDAMDAVAVEIAAALSISQSLAASHVRYARALREQLPMVGRAFIAGDIDEATFRACVFRTGLITDDQVLAEVDKRLSLCVGRWGSMTRSKLAARIDKIVARLDLDAVRQRRDRIAGRDVFVGDVDNGLAEITATVYAPDGHAFADRLTELAGTVCDDDGRTMAQRRSDAIRALTAGQDRLGCCCGQIDCPAGGRTASAVVIHVIAEQATVDGSGQAPAAMLGYEGLIPAELIAELAKAARLRPLIHPADAPPEVGYVPSRALADFIRCRDLTCRFPGCDRPASASDIDHTIPHGDGGCTQAGNLKCLCRLHHLAKTFWGWSDRQLRDGTVIWTSPAGEQYVTTPGSALIFPDLCAPTALAPVHEITTQRRGDRAAMMPRRARTRDQERAAAITAERRHNHERRTAPRKHPGDDEHVEYQDTFTKDLDPPPF